MNMLVAAFSAGLLGLATFSLWLANRLLSENSRRWLFLWVPVVLLASASTFFTVNFLMGLPSGTPPEKFTLLSYIKRGESLYIWGIKENESVPRTWEIPYSRKKHEELERGRQEMRNGSAVQFSGFHSAGDSVMHSFRPLDGVLPRKDAEEQK